MISETDIFSNEVIKVLVVKSLEINVPAYLKREKKTPEAVNFVDAMKATLKTILVYFELYSVMFSSWTQDDLECRFGVVNKARLDKCAQRVKELKESKQINLNKLRKELGAEIVLDDVKEIISKFF